MTDFLVDAPPILQLVVAFIAYKSPEAFRNLRSRLSGNGRTPDAVENLGNEIRPILRHIVDSIGANAQSHQDLLLYLSRIETRLGADPPKK